MKQILISFFILPSFYSNCQQMLMFKDAKIPRPSHIDSTVYIWNKCQLTYNQLTSTEQDFYYWVNYSRNNPKKFFDEVVMPIIQVYPQLNGSTLSSLKSDLYITTSLPMFYLSDTLITTSKNHSKDITSHNINPSHNSSDGSSFLDRFKKAGLKTCGSENISFSGGDGDVLFMLVMLYLDINVPDLGHRKTLLNPNYQLTGIGISKFTNNNTFLVEDFACKQN